MTIINQSSIDDYNMFIDQATGVTIYESLYAILLKISKISFSVSLNHLLKFVMTHLEQCRCRYSAADFIKLFSAQLTLTLAYCLKQGILKGEVSLYHWPPVWLVWNQLYDNWQILFLFAKQANPNQSNRRSMVQWYFPLLVFPALSFDSGYAAGGITYTAKVLWNWQ